MDGPAALATLPPELASLVPLVNHGTQPAERVVQASLFRSLDVADPRPREDAYACTAALAALYFDRALVRRRVEERMIVESPQMQELLRERTETARRQAAEQALPQGVQQGLQRNRVEGKSRQPAIVPGAPLRAASGCFRLSLSNVCVRCHTTSERLPSHAWRPQPHWRSGSTHFPERPSYQAPFALSILVNVQ
ncbi:MAG: hypothetical protein C4289_17615 [Chloroflexota bacterium]